MFWHDICAVLDNDHNCFQDAALTVSEKTVTTLKNLAQNDEGFKNVKSGATNVLGTLGVMNSGSSTKDPGSLAENKTIIAVRALIYLYFSTVYISIKATTCTNIYEYLCCCSG